MEWLEGGASGSAGQCDVEVNVSGLLRRLKSPREERIALDWIGLDWIALHYIALHWNI